MWMLRKSALTTATATGIAVLSAVGASAFPLALAERTPQLFARLDDAPIDVRYRRGRGGAAIGGLAAGIIIGSAIASQPYYYRPYPYYSPAYPAYGPYTPGDAVAYCVRRFRSYDPYTGTYLGFDGYRHPCP
jgi:hypothetical protein